MNHLLIYNFFLILLMIDACRWSSKQCGCWFNDATMFRNDRIVGGIESVPHSWPWMISVRKRSERTPLGLPICGGTLISDRHVLSAAHCFYESLVKKKEPIDEFLFLIGAHFSHEEKIDLDENLLVSAKSIILHENYNPFRQTDDIALIELQVTIDFKSIHFGAICLPRSEVHEPQRFPIDDSMLVAIGWGKLRENDLETSPTLQEIILRAADGRNCDRVKAGKNLLTQFCASTKDSPFIGDTCQGDSGGPLMMKNKHGYWFLAGITSYGKGCARSNQLGVYTRVSMYLTWIDQVFNKLKANLTAFDQIQKTNRNQCNRNLFAKSFLYLLFCFTNFLV